MQAFPGAYGWGAESVGGRGGYIYEVTNLDAKGPGSLDQVCRVESGPRTVVFRIGGLIDLEGGAIPVRNPYITIAGQTAPGSGITLNGSLNLETHNVVGRFIRHRRTTINPSAYPQGFRFRPWSNEVHDIILDHCSAVWSKDDTVDIWHEGGSYAAMFNITIQNSLLGEPFSSHPTIMICASDPTTGRDKLHHISILNNLFANCGYRNPLMGSRHSEVVNNLVYNWYWYIHGFVDEAEVDFVNNYWKPGPGDQLTHRIVRDAYTGDPLSSVYVAGNILPGELDDPAADNWPFLTNEHQGGGPVDLKHRRLVPLAPAPYPVPVQSAADVLATILDDVGASRRLNADGSWAPNRDAVDDRLIADVINGTGSNIPNGGVISEGTLPPQVPGTPYIDTDGDGISDEWEIANGLNENDPVDGPIIDLSGYSNVELFLNGETTEVPPMSVVTDLEAVEAALRQEALDLTVQADAIAQAIIDLRAADDALDAAADVIEAD